MSPKKLIEVSIPLAEINKASATEKSLRHGNPSTLHLWWSRKPLATTRAVLWASLVDDPDDDSKRKELHNILAQLVKWENTNNPELLALARSHLPDSLPEFLDPFAGGGSIPLEAQRLGLTAHAHDLNPIAVMLNKAMIEIPPKFSGKHTVHPDRQRKFTDPSLTSHAASGLAQDVEYYGGILEEKAFAQIGHLYPKIHTPDGDATVIAWLWARTVKCPNPNCKCHMPLVSSFMLSTKKGRQAWVVPHVHQHTDHKSITYTVETSGTPTESPKTGKGKFICSACQSPVSNEYLHAEFSAHRDGRVMLAVVAEGKNGRLYLPADAEHVQAADVPRPDDFPDAEMPDEHHFSPRLYGMPNFADLFTNRQLTMLTAFSDLLPEVQEEVRRDALRAGWPESDAKGYAEAVRVYLAFAVDKLTAYHSNVCLWHTGRDVISHTFGRQAIPMVWNYAEGNPFCNSTGGFDSMLGWIVDVLKKLPADPQGEAHQHDAQMLDSSVKNMIVSTDPPYYDNIGYADLSDYFYIWMRRNLRGVYPELFKRVLVPKDEELIATPYRHDDDPKKAREYFESGMLQALKNIYQYATDDYPVTIYYAYKQKERDSDGETSAGWETMLKAVINAGFQVTATWPMRTELTTALKAKTNSLGSSVVLVCRKRPENAKGTTKARFDDELSAELKEGLDRLRNDNIAPVDVPQAAIGFGMGVYSKYSRVVDTEGHVLTVGDVLRQIDRLLDPDAMELDSESRFCAEVYGLSGADGVSSDDAEKISRRAGVAVDAVVRAGAAVKDGSSVRLTEREKLNMPDSPEKWEGVSLWRCAQILTHELNNGKGEDACAVIVYAIGKARAERARELVYRLYLTAERRKLNRETVAYNSLIVSWPDILKRYEENVRKGKNEVRYQLTLGLEEN